MATVNRGTPPNGLWKGLAVNGTHSLLVELQLRFASGRVTGTYTLKESKRSPQSGAVAGTYAGSRVTFQQAPSGGTFRGRAEALPKNEWMIYGRLAVTNPRKSVGTLTVFHAGPTFFISGVWDGSRFE